MKMPTKKKRVKEHHLWWDWYWDYKGGVQKIAKWTGTTNINLTIIWRDCEAYNSVTGLPSEQLKTLNPDTLYSDIETGTTSRIDHE